MKRFVLLSLFMLVACQDFNSNTFDKDRYGNIDLTGSASFKAAYPVLQDSCMNCHYHAGWAEYTDEQDWITANLVVAGDAANSELITRIKNFGAASSNMPLGGSALSPTEYAKLLQWVQP